MLAVIKRYVSTFIAVCFTLAAWKLICTKRNKFAGFLANFIEITRHE